LTPALIAFLSAAVPTDGDDALHARIAEFAKNENALPNADRSLRDVLAQFVRFSTSLEEPSQQLRRGVGLLKSDADAEAALNALRSIVRTTIATIETERLERLKQRPIDTTKLERLRTAMEAAVLSPEAKVPFFRGFAIETVAAQGASEPYSAIINGIAKAMLVEPPMEAGNSDSQAASFADAVQRMAGSRVWGLFCGRPREKVGIAARVEQEEFWREAKELAARVGPEPVLVVSREAEGRALRRFLYPVQGDKAALVIERKPRAEVGGLYISTVEGVDVYGADWEAGTAWLFSARALRSVRYFALDAAKHHVTLKFEPIDDRTGRLRAQFQQEPTWDDSRILEIQLEDPHDEDN
jgi:hypothetical protein